MIQATQVDCHVFHIPTVWRETLVVGKFGKLSAKLRTFSEIKFGKLLYRVLPLQLSFGVV